MSFVRFVLHKNFTNRKNQYNQVGLTGLNIIGTPGVTTGHRAAGHGLDTGVLSEYDDLSFLMYTDKEVGEKIKDHHLNYTIIPGCSNYLQA